MRHDAAMKRRRLLAAFVIVGGIALFAVDWGGEDCQGAPCDEGFLWKIWAAVGIFVIWLAALVWLLASVLTALARARRSKAPRRHA